MKKKLLWTLTLVLLALFPYQNAKASLVQLSRDGWSVYNVSSEYAGLDGSNYVTGDKAIDGNMQHIGTLIGQMLQIKQYPNG